jgi:hypothetical protein
MHSPARSGYSRPLWFAIGILVIAAVFFLLQFSAAGLCCGDFDGYYHIQWSHLLWNGLHHGHFPPSFTWLPLTTLSPQQYADQHLLFHLLLIPFTWLGDLTFSAKTATVLFSSAGVFSLYWLLLRYRTPHPLLWLLALLGCSWLFYVRLNMPKAQGLSIIFMVIGIVLLLERRYIWLWPTAFLYVWAYNLFVVLAVAAVLWVVVLAWSERRLEWRPLLWTGLGIITGFVVNPYFPKGIQLFLEHLIAKTGSPSPLDAGSEWRSFSSWDFLKSSLLACAAMIVGYVAFGYVLSLVRGDRARAQRPLLFALFSSVLLLMSIRSIRFLEYWPPFAVLFAAFTLQAIWQNRWEAQAEISSAEPERVSEPLGSAVAPRKKSASSWIFEPSVIGFVLVVVCLYNVQYARMIIRQYTAEPDRYSAGAEWLRTHVTPGTLIFNLRYEDFPKLFFYDTGHTYVSGLDPLYLENKHPDLAELSQQLYLGKQPNPAYAVHSDFAMAGAPGVSYVFASNVAGPPSRGWLDYMQQSGFDIVYQDQDCTIFRIRN